MEVKVQCQRAGEVLIRIIGADTEIRDNIRLLRSGDHLRTPTYLTPPEE